VSGTNQQPPDGLGDGTATTPTVITQNVDDLTLREAVDYRRELIHAICEPGIEYDESGKQKEVDEAAYKEQLVKVDNYISAFGIY
jgi:hypothetical protein